MAAAFLTALANVPWGQVIDHAPKLVEQAQRLIGNVRAAPAANPISDSATEMAELRARVQALTTDAADLRADLTQASELLAELAKTNQVLIAKLTEWKAWFFGLAGISIASLAFSAIAIAT